MNNLDVIYYNILKEKEIKGVNYNTNMDFHSSIDWKLPEFNLIRNYIEIVFTDWSTLCIGSHMRYSIDMDTVETRESENIKELMLDISPAIAYKSELIKMIQNKY